MPTYKRTRMCNEGQFRAAEPLLKRGNELQLQSETTAATMRPDAEQSNGAAMSDKLVARIREMRKVLRKVEPKLTGKLRRLVHEAIESADKCTPPDNRVGKQLKFSQQTVMQAVEQCSGSKAEAAKLLGCSLRTVYTVFDRGDPKPKRAKRKPFALNPEAVQACAQQMVSVARAAAAKTRGALRSSLVGAAERCADRLPVERQPMFTAEQVEQAVAQHRGDKNAAAKQLGCSLSTVYAMLRRKDA